MPRAGNIAKTMTSNGKQFTVTRSTVHCCKWWLESQCGFQILLLSFVLLYNKSLNDWSLGEQWILFPSNLNVSLDFVSGNIEILGKQNSLFPSGPVIKCLMLYFWCLVWQRDYTTTNCRLGKCLLLHYLLMCNWNLFHAFTWHEITTYYFLFRVCLWKCQLPFPYLRSQWIWPKQLPSNQTTQFWGLFFLSVRKVWQPVNALLRDLAHTFTHVVLQGTTQVCL